MENPVLNISHSNLLFQKLLMRYAIFTILLFSIILIGCSDNNQIKIKFQLNKTTLGQLKGKYIYLVNQDTGIMVDSLVVYQEENHFTIPIDTNKFSEIFKIVINDTGFINGNRIPFKRPLGYFNPYKTNVVYSTFYIEPKMNKLYLFNGIKETPNGKIFLPNEFINNKNIRNPISKQNDILHKEISLSYIDTNSDQRVKTISNNISTIKKYPYSILLLKQVFYYKNNFRINDLKTQLTYFNNDIKKTSLFKRIEKYLLSNTSLYDKSYPDLIELENNKGEYKKIGNSKSKMNLIVYWSWWCGPCRKEIPDLKELYEKYRDKGLHITSISIDPEKSKWHETLKAEKMEWEQLIVSSSNLDELKTYYDINSIPKSYLYDDKKNLIEKFSGFSENNLIKLKSHLSNLD
jgi:thiol-disulfide isomerase/thioredoxin